jgi:hypothetical protein
MPRYSNIYILIDKLHEMLNLELLNKKIYDHEYLRDDICNLVGITNIELKYKHENNEITITINNNNRYVNQKPYNYTVTKKQNNDIENVTQVLSFYHLYMAYKKFFPKTTQNICKEIVSELPTKRKLEDDNTNKCEYLNYKKKCTQTCENKKTNELDKIIDTIIDETKETVNENVNEKINEIIKKVKKVTNKIVNIQTCENFLKNLEYDKTETKNDKIENKNNVIETKNNNEIETINNNNKQYIIINKIDKLEPITVDNIPKLKIVFS